jgi:hypothetical protein
MGKELQVFFIDKIKEQAKANAAKYGEQDPLRLLAVCSEELGEATHEFLKSGCSEKFRIEIIHLVAVLYELYGK